MTTITTTNAYNFIIDGYDDILPTIKDTLFPEEDDSDSDL